MSTKLQLCRSFPPHFPLSSILKITARMQNSAPFGNLIASAVETVVDKAKRRSRGCVVFCVWGHSRMGGHSNPHIRRICDPSIGPSTTNQMTPPNATPGGMWSGCAGSRTFQRPGVASQSTFGVWQGGHRHRWS